MNEPNLEQNQTFADYYAILGLNRSDSNPEIIKKRFRELARRFHPDIKGGNSLEFSRVYDAYYNLYDEDRRRKYDALYLKYQLLPRQQVLPKPYPNAIEIPASRIIFAGNVTLMARQGTLNQNIYKKNGKWRLRNNYDLELPLYPEELKQQLCVKLPVVTRTICPDCLGSDSDCFACNGRGSYKKTRTIRLQVEEGFSAGEIVNLDLRQIRLESLSHFKKKILRIKVTRRPRPA